MAAVDLGQSSRELTQLIVEFDDELKLLPLLRCHGPRHVECSLFLKEFAKHYEKRVSRNVEYSPDATRASLNWIPTGHIFPELSRHLRSRKILG